MKDDKMQIKDVKIPPKRPLPKKDIVVKLEIGPDLRRAIEALLKSVGSANSHKLFGTLSPGDEVQRAFGIDLTIAALKAAGSSNIFKDGDSMRCNG